MQFPAVTEYTKDQIFDRTLSAALKAKELLAAIVLVIKPGMTESFARMQAQELHRQFGVEKNWHNPYIRFGSNTILTFQDKAKEDKVLQEEDIAYIDIGPIINGVEGDVGCTLVFGENQLFQNLKKQCEAMFYLGLDYWKKQKPTGIELYNYIKVQTEKVGLCFNLNPAGHLIGAFPHKGWKEGLNTYPYFPEPGHWILEIQIRDKELPYGAFFEEILI